MDRDIFRKIKRLRVKLEKAILEKGLNSAEVEKLSDKMNELLNEYENSIKIIQFPKNCEMMDWYKKSYEELKKITSDFKKFPSVKEWDMYARNSHFLNHASLEYISKLNWNNLRIKVERELNFRVIKKV